MFVVLTVTMVTGQKEQEKTSSLEAVQGDASRSVLPGGTAPLTWRTLEVTKAGSAQAALRKCQQVITRVDRSMGGTAGHSWPLAQSACLY